MNCFVSKEEIISRLKEDFVLLESWGAYADDYFKKKHEFAEDMKQLEDFIKKLEEPE